MEKRTSNHDLYQPDAHEGTDENPIADELNANYATLDTLLKHIHDGGDSLGTSADPLPEQHVRSAHTEELSVTDGPTETTVYRSEDNDGTTPITVDTGQLPDHDQYNLIVIGEGTGPSNGPSDVEITVNNSTTTYRYTTIDQDVLNHVGGGF